MEDIHYNITNWQAKVGLRKWASVQGSEFLDQLRNLFTVPENTSLLLLL